MSELSELLRQLRTTCQIEDCWTCKLQRKAADEIDRLQARLDFLLRFIKCDNVGDEDVVIGAIVDAERLEESLLIDESCGVSGCLMDGWTCDMNQAIDNAIKRESEKARNE